MAHWLGDAASRQPDTGADAPGTIFVRARREDKTRWHYTCVMIWPRAIGVPTSVFDPIGPARILIQIKTP